MNDTIFEGPEDLMAVLSTVERVVTLVPDTANVTIQDDDGECECAVFVKDKCNIMGSTDNDMQ